MNEIGVIGMLALYLLVWIAFAYPITVNANRISKKRRLSQHDNNTVNIIYCERFLHTYQGDDRPSVFSISTPAKLRNFKEIFTGSPGPLKCDGCNSLLTETPISLSLIFSGKVLETRGKYCQNCDEEPPQSMHVMLTVEGCLAMPK